MKKWLVEILLKEWRPDLKDGTRIVGYEEVSAENERSAKFKGFDMFQHKYHYEPAMRKKTDIERITVTDCYAHEAIEI